MGRLKKMIADGLSESTSIGNIDGASYTCYRYETQLENNQLVIKMSQSFLGRCEGLWSAEEGDKTYTMIKGKV